MVASEEFLLVGYIVSAFGLQGQVKMRAVTDRPEHMAAQVYTLYVGARHTPYRLRSMFEHKPGLLVLTLDGVHTREQAEDLRGSEVFIHERDAAPLEEDEYYLHDLYGLQVETAEGEALGEVRDVLETGANNVLIVARPGQGDLLIPMIREVVQHLDIAQGRIVVRLLEGLG
jgi:16S rRNA processing protein RimM